MKVMSPPEHRVRPSDQRCDAADCDAHAILMLQRARPGGGFVEAWFCEQHMFDVSTIARTIKAADHVKIPSSDDVLVVPDVETTPGESGR